MAVRLVREEDPQAQERPALKLIAPPEPVAVAVEPQVVPAAPPVPSPPPAPAEGEMLQQRLAANAHAVGLLIALANVVSVRFALILTVGASAALTAFAETQHTTEAVVAAAIFTLLGLIPMVALALRKG